MSYFQKFLMPIGVPRIIYCWGEELPAQMVWVPLRTPAMGAAVTVIVRDAVASAHPPVPETV